MVVCHLQPQRLGNRGKWIYVGSRSFYRASSRAAKAKEAEEKGQGEERKQHPFSLSPPSLPTSGDPAYSPSCWPAPSPIAHALSLGNWVGTFWNGLQYRPKGSSEEKQALRTGSLYAHLLPSLQPATPAQLGSDRTSGRGKVSCAKGSHRCALDERAFLDLPPT